MDPILDDDLHLPREKARQEYLRKRALIYLVIMVAGSLGLTMYTFWPRLLPVLVLESLLELMLPPLVLGYVLEGLRRIVQVVRDRKPHLPLWYEGWERCFSWWIVLVLIRLLVMYGRFGS